MADTPFSGGRGLTGPPAATAVAPTDESRLPKADTVQARMAVSAGVECLHVGDRTGARRWAFHALSLHPEDEPGWLLLAGLAPANRRRPYLRHLLTLHPSSAREQQAWAELGPEPAALVLPAENLAPVDLPPKAEPPARRIGKRTGGLPLLRRTGGSRFHSARRGSRLDPHPAGIPDNLRTDPLGAVPRGLALPPG